MVAWCNLRRNICFCRLMMNGCAAFSFSIRNYGKMRLSRFLIPSNCHNSVRLNLMLCMQRVTEQSTSQLH